MNQDTNPTDAAQEPSATLPMARAKSEQRNRLLGIALFVVVALYDGLGAYRRERPETARLTKRASRVMDGLRDTKAALLALETANSAKPSSTFITARRKEVVNGVLEGWRSLMEDADANPSDVRRYAIALTAFDPNKSAETLKAFQRLKTLKPPQAPLKGASAAMREAANVTPVLPLEEELALWSEVYGDKPLAKSRVPEIKTKIIRLKLKWFERLALEKLYSRAGMQAEARREREGALASARVRNQIANIQMQIMLLGALAWVLALSQSRARKTIGALWESFQKNASAETSEAPFSYRSRTLAFTGYLLVPFLMLFVGQTVLAPAMRGFSALWAVRADNLIGIAENALILAALVWFLRAMRRTETENRAPTLSVRETLSALGLRGKGLATEIAVGIVGFMLMAPLTLLAGIVSQALFSKFATPPHPVLFSIALIQTPWDRALLFFQTAFMVALTEETLFRGTLFPALKQRRGAVAGLALSATIFAILHPTLPAGFLPLFVMGASFAVAYELRKSLTAGIVMHFLNNGLVLAAQMAVLAQ